MFESEIQGETELRLIRSSVMTALIMFVTPAWAAVFTYSFTGTVDFMSAPLVGGTVVLGDAVSGTFSFDTSVPEAGFSVGDPTQSIYLGASSGSVNIGAGGHFATFSSTLAIVANNCCSGFDGFQISKGGALPGTVGGPALNGYSLAPTGAGGPQQLVLMSDTSQSVFSSDQLSAVPFPLTLASFTSARGSLKYGDGTAPGTYELRYSIDTLVPAPAPGALALLGLGLASLGAARRRKAA